MSDPLASAFFVVGPTAVGKSELAAALAQACGGEVIGADAFQVYRGLDLLSAKPSEALREAVPHHLIGTVGLEESYHVARYRQEALAAIGAVCARGKVPVICGGTGLYVRALTHGLAELPPGDPALREELAAQPLAALQERLAALDPEGARQVDLANPRRVIRALEVTLASGKPFSAFRQEWEGQEVAARGVLLERPREELYERVALRCRAMLEEGVLEEVRAVGDAIGPGAAQMIGWRELSAVLRGKMTREEALDAMTQATRRYVKRQATWFKRERWLTSLAAGEPGALSEMIRLQRERC